MPEPKVVVLGRPKSAAKIAELRRLYRKEKLTKLEIARRLSIDRTSVVASWKAYGSLPAEWPHY